MRYFAILLLIAAAPQEDTGKHLKPLAWMVGEWDGKGTFMGNEYTDAITVEWALNKNFLKMTYVAKMGDQVVWKDTSMLGWDRDKKALTSFSFGMDGTIGRGDEIKNDDEKTWEFKGELNSQDPTFRNFKSIIKKIDDDTYTEEVKSLKDGKYETVIKSKRTRRKKKDDK